jgi:farnesyl diphosphate synthase
LPTAAAPAAGTESLRRFAARVERALDERLPRAIVPPRRLHEAMRYATLGAGKRVRAALVYASGLALGAREEVLDTPACAVELIHAYSLVHDDLPCMDDDDLRRGQPTCHKAYDEGTALLVGDALQTLAFELLASDPALTVSPERRLEMIALLARAAGSLGMAGGQAMDLAAVGTKLTLPQLEAMHRRKTGALIRAAVRLGALAAPGEDPALVAALDDYARAIGLAFQIADDILDVEGNIAGLGKKPGGDAARGKPTYPAVLGLEGARAEAQGWLAAALESLAPLGDNGRLLAELARFIVERRL